MRNMVWLWGQAVLAARTSCGQTGQLSTSLYGNFGWGVEKALAFPRACRQFYLGFSTTLGWVFTLVLSRLFPAFPKPYNYVLLINYSFSNRLLEASS